MKILEAKPEDAEIIESLAKKIWPEAYKAIISQDQIAYMLNLMYSPEKIKAEILSGTKYFLVKDENELLAYASVSIQNSQDIKLNKLYRIQDKKWKGLGRTLLETCIFQAINWGGKYLILNVNKQNPAVNFYLNNGFNVREETVLSIGEGYVMDDFIMERQLLT